MATSRTHFVDELRGIEEQALGALDLVATTLDRTMEAVRYQDAELAALVVADDDRVDNVAKLVPLLGVEPPPASELVERILRMGTLARAEVTQSRQAFELRNEALAEDLVTRDAEINRLNREVFRAAVQIGTDDRQREWAMTMTLIARAIERIGDHAVDIGEQAAFVVTGLFREFSDASH